MPIQKETGFTPVQTAIGISLVIIIAIFVYQSTVKSPEISSTPTLSPSSSPTPIISPTPTPTTNSPIPSVKPVIKISPSPSPSQSPSSTPSSSPSTTPIPSPVSGVYKLDPSPEQNIKIAATGMGYSMSALLKDSNGEVLKSQKDFTFQWTVDDTSLFTTSVGNWGSPGYCAHGITDNPCPNNNMTINSQGKKGNTIIHVKAIYNPEGKTVGETQFNVEVY